MDTGTQGLLKASNQEHPARGRPSAQMGIWAAGNIRAISLGPTPVSVLSSSFVRSPVLVTPRLSAHRQGSQLFSSEALLWLSVKFQPLSWCCCVPPNPHHSLLAVVYISSTFPLATSQNKTSQEKVPLLTLANFVTTSCFLWL